MLKQKKQNTKEYFLVSWEVDTKMWLDVQEIYWGSILVIYCFETNYSNI